MILSKDENIHFVPCRPFASLRGRSKLSFARASTIRLAVGKVMEAFLAKTAVEKIGRWNMASMVWIAYCERVIYEGFNYSD